MTTVDGLKLHEEGTPMEAFNQEWLFKGPDNIYLTYKFCDIENPPKRRTLYHGDWREYTGMIEKDDRHSGPNASRWNGGLIERNGQVYVRMDHKHPGMDSRCYVRQHVLEVEEDLCRYLWSFERVFHRDGNKMNNCKSNLGIRFIFGETRRRWFIDQYGNFDRWNSRGIVITQDNKAHIVPREFSKKIRTNATMPPYPYNLYDHVVRRDDDTGITSHFVGATCKLCGKPHWQNVTKQNDTIDYDQICKDCTKFKLHKNWQTVENTPYWLETGKSILVTYRRFDRYVYLADMRFDTINETLAKFLCTIKDVQFWVIPVDNSTPSCIVKEA